MGLFASMGQDVALQVAFCDEALAAVWVVTYKGSFTGLRKGDKMDRKIRGFECGFSGYQILRIVCRSPYMGI